MWLCWLNVCDLLTIKLYNPTAGFIGNAQDINSLNKFEKHIGNISFHAFQGQLNQLTSKHTHFSEL